MLTVPLLALAGLLATDPATPAPVIAASDIVRVEVTGLKQLQKSAPADYLVRPDGTVSLGGFGNVAVAGKTTEQAAAAIAEVVGAYLSKKAKRKLAVAVSVGASDAKFFYVITETDGRGEQVTRATCFGNETVLDAVAPLLGLRATPAKVNIWIARGNSVLPIDWRGITERGLTTTNYQILPGDRLYLKAAK
jgi:polysaccharide export outer membrane protein